MADHYPVVFEFELCMRILSSSLLPWLWPLIWHK